MPPTLINQTTSATNYSQKSGNILKFTSVPHDFDVEFLAFLTNFTQQFNCNWNQETVYGRNDQLATFVGTTRTCSISWDLPAENLTQAKDNLIRCMRLTQMLYPAYTEENPEGGFDASTLSKPPLVRVKFANLLDSPSSGDGVLAYINSLSWTYGVEMGHFTETNAEDAKIYPQVINLSVEVGVLHDHGLGFSGEEDQFGGDSDTDFFPFGAVPIGGE